MFKNFCYKPYFYRVDRLKYYLNSTKIYVIHFFSYILLLWQYIDNCVVKIAFDMFHYVFIDLMRVCQFWILLKLLYIRWIWTFFFLSHLRLLRYIVSYNVLLNSFIFTSSVFPVSKLFPSCTYHSQGQSVHCLWEDRRIL